MELFYSGGLEIDEKSLNPVTDLLSSSWNSYFTLNGAKGLTGVIGLNEF
jgi:hypothetical protein